MLATSAEPAFDFIFGNFMHSWPKARLLALLIGLACATSQAQRVQFPAGNELRPVQAGQVPSTAPIVPLNGATQAGVYPPTGGAGFDPYYRPQSNLFGGITPTAPPAGSFGGASSYGAYPAPTYPTTTYAAPNYAGPTYNGSQPVLPGAGQSGVLGSYPSTTPNYNQPGVYPNSSPSSLYPGTYPNPNQPSGGIFGNLFGTSPAPVYPAPTAQAYNGNLLPPQQPYAGGGWNPQGALINGGYGYPQFIRLFQGTRFRHAYVHGNDDADALKINDTDLSVAFAFPNFLYSTQPIYIMPSFSLHSWDGPKTAMGADLPALAYSAFLDVGWQTDPRRILGAELGVRVGVFTDFDTFTSDSLRVMGRGIGRIRVTPRATVKLGVLYLDRNRIKLLPAGGLLWQPNPQTRFDLFFPEPKLAHYLSTMGATDSWWYVGGYYGGGAWTVTRRDGSEQSIDINDLRLVLGIEWGRNEQLREGRRTAFLEFGYVFERELLYDLTPADNIRPQDTFMFRAGLGY